jgi:hypothetical protein
MYFEKKIFICKNNATQLEKLGGLNKFHWMMLVDLVIGLKCLYINTLLLFIHNESFLKN